MTELVIPQVGESITVVYIARWFVQPGEAVVEGEPVLEIDSDKATLEVPAVCNGVLLEQLAQDGDEVPIGALIARIDETATAAPKATATEAAPAAAESKPE